MPRSLQSTVGSSTAHLSPSSSTSSRTMAPRRQLESVTSAFSEDDADEESDGGIKRRRQPTPPLIYFEPEPASGPGEKLRALLAQMDNEVVRSSTPLGIRRGTDSQASSSSRRSDESPPRPGRGVWRDGRSRRGFPPPSPTRLAAQAEAATSRKLVDVESVATPEIEEESPPTPPPRIHHYLSASASRRAEDRRTPTPPQPHPRALAVHAARLSPSSPKEETKRPSPLESFIASKPAPSRRAPRTVEPAPESSEVFARGIGERVELDVDESAISPPWEVASTSSSEEVAWSPPTPVIVEEESRPRRQLFRSPPISTAIKSTPPRSTPPQLPIATPHPPGGWEFTPAGRKVRFSPPAEPEIIHRVKFSPLRNRKAPPQSETSFVKRLFDSPRKAIQAVAPRRKVVIPKPSTTHRDAQPRLAKAEDEVVAAYQRVEEATHVWIDAVRAGELAVHAVRIGWNWGTWTWWLAMELLLIWGVFRVTIDYATSNPMVPTLNRPTPPLPPAFLVPHKSALSIFDVLDHLDLARQWEEWGWGNEALGLPL